MSEKPSVIQYVVAMIEAAHSVESARDLPEPGTFARNYVEASKPYVDADNIEAYLHGTGAINLLTQEAIVRITMAADETAQRIEEDPEASDEDKAYAEGVSDGAKMVAEFMLQTADRLVYSMVEHAAVNEEFDHIISSI